MIKRKHMKQDDFDKIKTLQEVGVKQVQVQAVLGFSKETLRRAFAAATFDEYQELGRKYFRDRAPKPEEIAPIEIDINDGLRLVFERLTEISDRLKFIEEHIPVEPERRLHF